MSSGFRMLGGGVGGWQEKGNNGSNSSMWGSGLGCLRLPLRHPESLCDGFGEWGVGLQGEGWCSGIDYSGRWASGCLGLGAWGVSL